MNSKLHLRRGTAMIEMLTVIAIAGTLASGCAMVLRHAYLVHRDSLQTVAKMRSLDLIRTRWMDDVQAAVGAQIGDSLELRQVDESSVVYSVDEKKIERQKNRGGEIVARDSWRFPDPVSVRWTIDSSKPVSLLSMELSSLEHSNELPTWKFLARLSVTPSRLQLAGGRDE